MSVSLNALDELIVDLVITRLSQPDILDLLTTGDDERDARRSELRKSIQADEAYLAEIGREAALNRDVGLLMSQEALVRPRIKKAELELRSLTSVDPALLNLASSVDIRLAWDEFSLEERRRVIGGLMVPLIDRAPKPGRRGKVHERVRIEWVGTRSLGATG